MKRIIAMFVAMLVASTTIHAADDVFDIKTVNGKKLTIKGTPNGINIDQYKGKVLFIEFWGTWCAPCLLSIPHHQRLQEKYKDKLAILSFETTPDVSRDQLKQYVSNTKKHIDMGRIEWYLKHKAKTEAAKKSLEKPIKELEEFKASNHKITYDVIAYEDGNQFVNYIGQRAGWKGYLPSLMVFDPSGNFVGILPGMPSEERLEAIMADVLKTKKK